jgi:hypothetical protein
MEKEIPTESVVPGECPTIHDEGVLEAGKKLLLNSVDDSRDYCRHMISLSTGAIPAYLAILKLWFPEDNVVPVGIRVFFAVPVIAFLLATLFFSSGYLPEKYEINVGNERYIEEVRSTLMRNRAVCGSVGFTLFCLGTVIAVVLVVFAT